MKIGENVQKGSFYILIKPFDVRNVHRVLQRTREVEIPTFPPTRRLCAVLARSKLIGFAVLAHPHCSFCFCTPSLAFSSWYAGNFWVFHFPAGWRAGTSRYGYSCAANSGNTWIYRTKFVATKQSWLKPCGLWNLGSFARECVKKQN